jgi:uncharacterized protein (DUF2236 family)
MKPVCRATRRRESDRRSTYDGFSLFGGLVFEAEISTEVSEIADPEERYFTPDSQIWRVDREMALLLAGGRALLMQISHPKVAAGVAEHSRFQDDPFARLHRTMSAMWSVVFDDRARARAALDRVARRHERVRGVVLDLESSHAGTRYDAFDQDLLLWVHATLIDSAMVAYDLFVRPLSAREKMGYYDDSKKLAALFGVAETIVPVSLVEFNAYMDQMLTGDMLVPGPTAKNLARDILYARPWIFKPAGPLFRFVTAGLLPEKLRDCYGLKWSKKKENMFVLLTRAVRLSLPLIPPLVRIVPNARAAEKAGRD